ncbi:MAG: hypothetical protein O6952_03270, partial [Planctomycetota bacterium]|nr:hypothetical protein [Planctomycetota bacterium]
FPTWQKRGPVLSQPFRLAPTGPPIWAFAWKGLLAAGRRYSGRNAILGASLCVGLGIGIRIAAQTQESDVWIMVIRSIGGMIVWTLYSFILFGPSPEGFGLIESMALLKPLPIRGPTVFLGSMLAEVSKAMFVFFLLWSAGAGFSSDWLQQNPMVGVGILVTSFAAMMLLVAVASAVRLAVVLWLPFTASFETGPTAIGHNLLIFALRILPIVGLLLAPVGFSVGAAMLMKSFAYAIPISLGLGVMILACEIVPMVMLGGWLYDRFDLVQDSRTFA